MTTSRNDITGEKLVSNPSSAFARALANLHAEYDTGWERIFGKCTLELKPDKINKLSHPTNTGELTNET